MMTDYFMSSVPSRKENWRDATNINEIMLAFDGKNDLERGR